MKLLIIDDNERLTTRTKERLRKFYIVEQANSGEAGLQMLSGSQFDLVILDLGLPGMTGEDVCLHIKKFWPETAILIVTGKDSTSSKVTLLGMGADDYITKPFDSLELHARIKALLRRKQTSTYQKLIVVGPLILDPNTRAVSRDGTPLTLRRKEYNILEYLCLNPNRVLTRDMIIHQAWSYASSDKGLGSVDVHIKQLRDKVDRPFPEKIIKTVYGLGYMLEVAHPKGSR